MSKVRFSFRRTLQLVEYEPVQFGVDFETDAEPDENVEDMIRRAYVETAKIFNEVQDDLIESFKAPRANLKAAKGGVPPKVTPAPKLPPKKKK